MIEISPVVIEIWGVENGDLVVPVNNTLVCCTSLLAADTQPCVLLYKHPLDSYGFKLDEQNNNLLSSVVKHNNITHAQLSVM